MMIRKLYFHIVSSLTILLLLPSCESRPSSIVIKKDYLTERTPLIGEKIFLDSLQQPVSIGMIDTFLCIINKYKNPILQVYDIYNRKVVYQVSGTDLLKNPFYFNRWYKDNGLTTFEVVDLSENTLYAFSESSDSSSAYLFKQQNAIPIPLSLTNRHYQYFSLDSSRNVFWGSYLGTDKSAGRYFYHTRASTSNLVWIPFLYKEVEKKAILAHDLPYINYSYLSYNEKKGIMGAGFKFYKEVEFLNKSGEQISVCRFEDVEPLMYQPEIMTKGDMRVYYNASFSTQQYLYLLCINGTQDDYNSNSGNIELHIFNWDGVLKAAIRLDRMQVGEFIVDENRKELYLLSYVAEDRGNPIIRYDISKVLTTK